MIDPREAKVGVFGLQGSGKTYYARELVKRNNLKVLVYSPHRHDFDEEPDNFYFWEGFSVERDDVDIFLRYAKRLCQKGVIDGVLMDEFDMLFRNAFELGPTAIDVIANHRHYGMCLIALSRRPQDIPAYFVESCKFLVVFALQGENVRSKLNGIYKGFGDAVLDLDYESHAYLLKQIGKPPQQLEKV